MSSLQIVVAYLPLLAIAGCIVLLFRRTGHGRTAVLLSALPAIVVLSSLLATLAGEFPIAGGFHGIWISAAALAALAFKQWPATGGKGD